MDAFLIAILDKGVALGIPVLAVVLFLFTREVNTLTVTIVKEFGELQMGIEKNVSAALQQSLQNQNRLGDQHERMTALLTQQTVILTMLISDPDARGQMAKSLQELEK